jgi:hypothetical protein
MEASLANTLDAGWWALTCSTIQGHAHDMGLLCPGDPGRCISEVANRFCNQGVPACETDKVLRHRQFAAVLSVIGGIATADSLGRRFPAVMPTIISEMRRFCNFAFPTTEQDCSAVALTANHFVARVGALCDDYAMRHLRR